jgi:hypothetical protein
VVEPSSVGIKVSRWDINSEFIDWSVHAHLPVAGGHHIAGDIAGDIAEDHRMAGRCQHLRVNTVSS